jgi:asparagine synthase (glutamine-hydrolysing)
VLSEHYEAMVSEQDFRNEREVLDPPLRTREELAYYRLFQRELTGIDPGDVVGRFAES